MDTLNTIQIDATVEWRYYREPEKGWLIAECDALGLVLTAPTHRELADMISRGLDLLFRDLANHGEMEAFLTLHHWQIAGKLPESLQDAHFDVPFELLAAKDRHGAAICTH